MRFQQFLEQPWGPLTHLPHLALNIPRCQWNGSTAKSDQHYLHVHMSYVMDLAPADHIFLHKIEKEDTGFN
jgi:hypothetical protein